MAVGGCADNAICALTQFFCYGVSLIHDEVLVENLEDLATCHVTHDCGRVLSFGLQWEGGVAVGEGWRGTLFCFDVESRGMREGLALYTWGDQEDAVVPCSL